MTQAASLPALSLISAVMVLLLSIGIRNGWDLVTYLAVERTRPNI